MWHKAIWKGHPVRLELTRVGLLVELANHYTTRGAYTSKKCFHIAFTGWIYGWIDFHSCKCVGHVILAPQIQPTCCIRCSPIKWGKLSRLAFTMKIHLIGLRAFDLVSSLVWWETATNNFTMKIQEGSHVRRWVIWLLQYSGKWFEI